MGTADRIERERLEKRARILEVARELFVEHGVEAVTLREIAAKIEYSTTAIYVHFKDKAALVDAMVTEDFAKFAANLEAVAQIPDPMARLRALHDGYIDFALAMPHHYRLLFMTPIRSSQAHPPHASPADIGGYRVLRATVAECIADKRFRDGFTDADAVAQILWSNVHGLVALLITKGDMPEFRWRSRATLGKLAYDMALGGIAREPVKKTRR